MGQYLVGQVCANGHAITSDYAGSPELRARYCEKCGAPSIHQCQKCQKDIRGRYHVSGVLTLSNWKPPAYCYDCGNPFSWTEKALSAVSELADESDLDENDKAQLTKSIKDLTTDTPQTEVALVKFKKLMKKAGAAVGPGIEKIVTTIATEAVKKSLGF